MKKLLYMFLFSLSLCCCNNDDDNNNCQGIDCLPPATQTGAGTFGCLVNGEVFIPGSGTNPLDCVYQFVDGGYYFALQGNKRDSDNNLIRISIGTLNLQLTEGDTFQLLQNEDGNAIGTYFFNTFQNFTSLINTGELTITKLDTDNQIVSGNFWFDVEGQNGVVHQIREGRFDMQYAQ